MACYADGGRTTGLFFSSFRSRSPSNLPQHRPQAPVLGQKIPGLGITLLQPWNTPGLFLRSVAVRHHPPRGTFNRRLLHRRRGTLTHSIAELANSGTDFSACHVAFVLVAALCCLCLGLRPSRLRSRPDCDQGQHPQRRPPGRPHVRMWHVCRKDELGGLCICRPTGMAPR